MKSRSLVSFFEEVVGEKPPQPPVINPRLSPNLIKYMKKDPGLAQNVSNTLEALEHDAIMRSRMKLNQ